MSLHVICIISVLQISTISCFGNFFQQPLTTGSSKESGRVTMYFAVFAQTTHFFDRCCDIAANITIGEKENCLNARDTEGSVKGNVKVSSTASLPFVDEGTSLGQISLGSLLQSLGPEARLLGEVHDAKLLTMINFLAEYFFQISLNEIQSRQVFASRFVGEPALHRAGTVDTQHLSLIRVPPHQDTRHTARLDSAEVSVAGVIPLCERSEDALDPDLCEFVWGGHRSANALKKTWPS